jgi:quercetin dioxygenase-like cupin family protein
MEGSQMKTILAIGSICFLLFVGNALTAPIAKHLIDSTPEEAVIVNLDEWFSTHPIKEGSFRTDKIFESPRNAMMLTTTKDTKGIGRHIHTQSDEIIYVSKGAGEMFQNGKWISLKIGDLHICPRGVAHGLRASGGGEISIISIYTPPQPKGGNDRVMIDD